ncbi:PD-(D/E)XK nuclease family protein [Herbiconiux sp.]|uniref:PD-(D/E)XK nuclease family protein n=1 Tax=Herbiconiux sp. TaxID=1871186 RepID=UPI0025BD2D42|nr:PD-(D/E)XK nuclease family protein [Herbiconiux sp.]
MVIYLPQVLSNRETALLKVLTEAADWRAIVGVIGDRAADEPVVNSLRLAGVDVEHSDDAAAFPTAGLVFHASDSDDEVRWVARQVLERMRATPGHRIAVLYASREPYARLLHDHFAAAGIVVNGPGVAAIRDRALVRGFLAVLDLPRGEFARADVFAAIDQAPIRAADGGRIPAARWERISREAGVVRGDDWEVRLSRLIGELEAKASELVARDGVDRGGDEEVAAASELDDETRERVVRLNGRVQSIEKLRAFVAGLRSELERGEELGSWSALSSWAVEMFHRCFGAPEELAGHLPLDEQYAAVVLEQTLRRLGELDAVQPTASLALLQDVLELEFDDALSNVGRFGEGVYLAPISASVGLSTDITYVVGLAEDSFPGRLTPDPILPDSVRRLVPGQLPLARESIADKRRQLLIAFGSAPDVVATFARGDLRRNVGRLPSRWLLPTLRALSGRPDLAATEWEDARSDAILVAPSHWNELRTTAEPATEQEWRIRAVAAGTPPSDAIIDSSLVLLEARAADGLSRFDGDLRGVEGLPDYAREPITVAPTTLEQYADCPYAYFVKRLLRIQPVELPEEIVTISPLNSGQLVHDSFDRFVRQLTDEGGLPGFGQPWTDADKLLLRDIASGLGDQYVAQGLAGHPRLWARERAAILHDLDLMLDADSEYRAANSSQVVATEVVFGMRGRPPVEVAVDGGVVHMAGSIDKVDSTSDGRLIVTDIKTGKAASFKGIEDDIVVGGTKLQLPVYVAAAAREFGVDADEIEAEYWFVRRDRGTRIGAALDDARRERYRNVVGTVVGSIASGLFPAKPPEAPDVMFTRCRYCNPDEIGHGEARLRYERKRHDPALASLIALVDAGATS